MYATIGNAKHHQEIFGTPNLPDFWHFPTMTDGAVVPFLCDARSVECTNLIYYILLRGHYSLNEVRSQWALQSSMMLLKRVDISKVNCPARGRYFPESTYITS